MEKFDRELNGYKRSEVNQFLSDVITQTEQSLKKIEKQNAEIEALKKELIHYQQIEQSLRLALDHAENIGSHLRKEAQVEANQIVEEARRNADWIVNDALLRSERIELKNATMEKNLRVFKRKLRSIVEQQLEVVEEIELLEVDE